MKTFGRYLVIGIVNGKERIASSFMRKQDAIIALNNCFEKISDNEWHDRLGQVFRIEKNTKEY